MSRTHFNALEKDQPWDVGENDVLAHSEIRVLSCTERAAVAVGAHVPASYVGIAGLGADAPSFPMSDRRTGVFGYDRRTALADITDGTAHTMMLAETGMVIGSWLQGGPATVRGLDPTQKPYIGPGRQFGGMHGGGTFVAFADGSVRRVSDSIAPRGIRGVVDDGGRREFACGLVIDRFVPERNPGFDMPPADDSLFLPPFLQKLADPAVKTVMLCGCGGGFDFVHSLLLYPELKRLGKSVVIGSYSFGDPHRITGDAETIFDRGGSTSQACYRCESTRPLLRARGPCSSA